MDQMFCYIFRHLTDEYADEIALIRQQFNREPFQWLEPRYAPSWP